MTRWAWLLLFAIGLVAAAPLLYAIWSTERELDEWRKDIKRRRRGL